MAVKSAIIIGGGIAGPAAAIALSQIGISCAIYEVRDGPATIGGAVNLTPNALRVIDHFGLLQKTMETGCPCEKIEMFSVATGQKLGELPFGSTVLHGYSSLRIGRRELQQLLLSGVIEAGIDVHYGKKLTGVEETEDSITAIFEDGTSASGDFLLGCDGIHSVVRTKFVDPDRTATYTGISTAYGMVPASAVTEPIPFDATALNTSCNGSLLVSYCNASKTSLFLAAVMEVKEQDQDGWRVRGKVADDTRKIILDKFESSKLPCLSQMTNAIEELFFYPVSTLGNGGLWSKGRALLIGDAAHAMMPAGNSIGLTLEDAMLLARLLDNTKPNNPQDVFPRYEEIRRPRIEKEYKHAAQRWSGVKTISWWRQRLREFVFWVYLAFFARHVDESLKYDIFKETL